MDLQQNPESNRAIDMTIESLEENLALHRAAFPEHVTAIRLLISHRMLKKLPPLSMDVDEYPKTATLSRFQVAYLGKRLVGNAIDAKGKDSLSAQLSMEIEQAGY
ncbi:MAG: hypothetical protein JWS12_522 [Candidatus Saccharibacteria bacterium]|nr:hypothetical protein [Candidatus Saccharibacteria bacterium]